MAEESAPETEAPPARATRPRVWPARLLKGAWLVFLVLVLGAASWLAWVYVGTDQLAETRAAEAIEGFDASCQVQPEPAEPSGTESPSMEGEAAEVVALFGFGTDPEQRWPVLAGTSEEALETGIGWYPQTAGAGEIGNMALVGYPVTNGATFANLRDLQMGDRVEVLTCSHRYIYVIDVAPKDLTVQAGDEWVLDAVPGQPGQRPTGRMITLITSQDALPTSDRSVGFGHLESATPR